MPLLQINFKLNVPPDEYARIAGGFGDAFASLEGMAWKIWMLNEKDREAGGIYLFRDDASLDAFLGGPLAAQVKAAPFLTDLSVKRFDVMADLTAVTRGPVEITTAV